MLKRGATAPKSTMTPLPSYHNLPPTDDDHKDASEGDSLLRGVITSPSADGSIAPRRCTNGTLRVALGALMFAATNAAATALYRRGGASVVSLYIIRSPVLYFINAGIVGVCGGDDEGRTTMSDVLLLRTGSPVASRLALLRSLLNSTKAVLLGVGFVFLTYADAFVVFKGVAVFGTIVVARCVLGRGERLSPRELACGALVLVGILLLVEAPSSAEPSVPDQQTPDADPTSPEWAPRHTAGVALVTVSGLLSAVSGTLMRHLSKAGGPHDGHTPPAMLLSFLTVTMFFVFGGVAIAGAVSGLAAHHPAFRWSALVWPRTAMDWALMGANCSCTLIAHLATASGYSTTRAGIVAFLQLTEIPWVYLLDVFVLGEATNTLKSVGSAVVFFSALAVALR